MIDKRLEKNYQIEIDPKLVELTDTEIVLEFSNILTSIYPSLIKLEEFCYDPFDEITENLFFNTVYTAFSGKYAVSIMNNETHKYGFSLHCYHKINHIKIRPKQLPISIKSTTGIELEISDDFFNSKDLVFINFGDTINFLSGDKSSIDLKNVNFEYSLFEIIDNQNGLTFNEQDQYWIKNSNVEFELVLEDFSKEEHKYYKSDLYADNQNVSANCKWKFWK